MPSNESDQSLDQTIKQYYQSQHISSERLQAIINDTQPNTRSRAVGFALLASIFLLVFATLSHNSILLSQKTGVVLREAALNHSTKLQMDSKASSIVELESKLTKLPFNIELPKSSLFEQLAVVGGRYCTISGNLAAHIKLSDPSTSQQYSLFLTPLVDKLDSMHSPETDIDGVNVRLWQENNVVYAFAASNDITNLEGVNKRTTLSVDSL